PPFPTRRSSDLRFAVEAVPLGIHGEPRSPPSGLRRPAAADDALAIAGGYVDPRAWIGVRSRGAGARVVPRRCAVVLAGLGDAVTLFRLEVRLGRRSLRGDEGRSRDGGRERRGGDEAFVHGMLLLNVGLCEPAPRRRAGSCDRRSLDSERATKRLRVP